MHHVTASPAVAGSTQIRSAVLFWTVFLLLSVACVWPIATSRYLPLVDLPQHASQVALWRAMATDSQVAHDFALHYSSPCAVVYFAWRGLMGLGLSLEAAGRVLVALCVVTVPAGVFALLKVRRRPVEWSLLVFPFVFTQSLAWGFIPYCFTYAMLFWALALFASWLERGGVLRASAVAVSGLLVMWGHALTGGFWGLCCGLLALGGPFSWRRRALAIVPLLPAGLFLLFWVARGGGNAFAPYYAATPWQWAQSFFDSVYGGTTASVTDAADLMQPVLALVLVGGVAGVLVPLRHAGGVAPLGGVRAVFRAFDVPLLYGAAAAFLLYLFMPFTMFRTQIINVRFASEACVLFVASLPPVAWVPGRALLLGCAGLVSVLVDGAVWRSYTAFNRQLGDPLALFAKLPPHASVDWPDGAERHLPPLELDVLGHFAVWADIQTLGRGATFTDRDQMLVRDVVSDPNPRFDARVVQSEEQIVGIESAGGRVPDAIVFFTPEPPLELLPIRGAVHGNYRLLGRTGGLNAYFHEPAP